MANAAFSSYKNYVGVTKVTTDGFIANSGGIDVGATSVTVTTLDGTPTTSMSAVFIDGPNTEACAISAYTGGVATIGATTYAHPQGCYILFLTTSGLGTASAYIPVRTPKIPDKYDQLYDTAPRGSLVSQVGVVQGLRSSDWSFEGDVFFDTIGYLLGGFFGAEDFTSGTPNTHAFSVKNSSNGQPAKQAWFVFDGVNTRIAVGRISSLELKYDPKSLLSYTTKLLGRASGTVANGTQSYSTVPIGASWRAAMTINSDFVRTPMSFDLTLTREESENIPTLNGTQDPYDDFVGAATGTAKVSYVMESPDDILTDYLTGTQEAITLAMSQGTGADEVGLAIQISEANYDSVEPTLTGKSYNVDDGSFTLVANADDASTSGGGLSPCLVTLTNSVGTGVYV